jgi:hypothetical protein
MTKPPEIDGEQVQVMYETGFFIDFLFYPNVFPLHVVRKR